jgi:lipoprotein-anchoring transpeptidase ErfK/SrfK
MPILQSKAFQFLFLAALGVVGLVGLTSCGSNGLAFGYDARNKMIVSVKDQKMLLVCDGVPLKSYKVSTSKFGVGDRPGSNCTPLGRMQVAQKIGGSAAIGSVFKSRRPTGEVLKPNAPGRDPVVTRILWLTGKESRNRNAFGRTIYIHGTPEENRLGSPASFGCIRMASKDVAELFNKVGKGADVFVIRDSIKTGNVNQASASSGKTGNSRKQVIFSET